MLDPVEIRCTYGHRFLSTGSNCWLVSGACSQVAHRTVILSSCKELCRLRVTVEEGFENKCSRESVICFKKIKIQYGNKDLSRCFYVQNNAVLKQMSQYSSNVSDWFHFTWLFSLSSESCSLAFQVFFLGLIRLHLGRSCWHVSGCVLSGQQPEKPGAEPQL